MKKLQRKVENLVLHVPGVERIISTGLLELNSQTYQQLISSMFKVTVETVDVFHPCLK